MHTTRRLFQDTIKKIERWETFKTALFKENPILLLLLGIWPVVALTKTAKEALIFASITLLLLFFSNFFVSLFFRGVPYQRRTCVFLFLIAVEVTLLDYFLRLHYPTFRESLGIFLLLLVMNEVILSRTQTFAVRNNLILSCLDALGAGFGYVWGMMLVGCIREILGNGTIFGQIVFGKEFHKSPMLACNLSGFAFILLGFLIGFFRMINKREKRV
ncbi:MAG: Rnf-Nqr domain containing protein [Candidatus Edwardsbacteria bacterium]